MSLESQIALEEPDPASEPFTTKKKKASQSSRGKLIWLELRSTARFWIGAITVLLIIAWALLGPALTHWGAGDTDLLSTGVAPNSAHWFGTDDIGHDLYVETALGLRISLVVGLVGGPLGTVIAALVGSFAGYLGGAFDKIVSWFIDLMLVLPSFFILLLISPALKSLGWVSLVLFIPAFGWMILAQVIRSSTRSLKDRDFVKAARFMGVSTPKVVFRHIIPNVASLLIIDATLGVVYAISTETALSYFGYGVQAPQISLGTLIAAGTPGATTESWQFLFPSAALVILLFAVGLVGDALRDAVDPTSGVTND
ncbi:MAG: ABC transporter permease [Allobranchiibius sp.]